jgi:glycosyltransferase involved in cell wall biosynthesis
MYFEKISKIYLKNVDYFIAPSRFIRDKYIENGFPKDKIVYIKPFIEISEFSPQFAPGKYILFFGRLHAQKGITDLINAVSGLSDVSLKIVGSGPEEEAISKLIQEKSASDKIELLGPLYGEKLKEIIRNSAFVVMPSASYENAPFSVIEAFALGKPVIASNIGGLPELIENGKTGLLFDAGNIADLKNSIEYLFSHPCIIRSMGLAARLFVEKNFSDSSHYEKILEIYNQALNKNKKT